MKRGRHIKMAKNIFRIPIIKNERFYQITRLLLFIFLFCAIIFAQAWAGERDTTTKFSMSNCKKIFAIHSETEEGFEVSKCIVKGPALIDYDLFESGSCIVIDLDTHKEKAIETPVGSLTHNQVYYIDEGYKLRNITDTYEFSNKNAAGICYSVPSKIDAKHLRYNSKFRIFNWKSESFKYCGIGFAFAINPDESIKCIGSSGTVRGFDSCGRGISMPPPDRYLFHGKEGVFEK